MSILDELFSDWAVLAAKAEKGELVKKKEIVRLLDSDAPIPNCAKPLLKGLITGSLHCRKGEVSKYESVKQSAVFFYKFFLDDLSNPTTFEDTIKKHSKLRGDLSPAGRAKEIIAMRYGVSTRTLENWLKEYNEQ